MLNLLKTTECSKRRLMDRRPGLEMHMLVQQTQLQATRTHDLATIRAFIAANETEDRALAGAVSTHKSDVLARVYLQRSAAQNILHAIRLMNF